MPATSSTDEILRNFDESAVRAESMFEGAAYRGFAIALLLFLMGLTALNYSQPLLAVGLMLAGLHFDLHSVAQLVQSNMSQQNRAMAHIVASVSRKSPTE